MVVTVMAWVAMAVTVVTVVMTDLVAMVAMVELEENPSTAALLHLRLQQRVHRAVW